MSRPADLASDLVSFDEFCSLVPDGQKADLIDGVIHMASPDSRRSDQVTNFVHFLLAGYCEARGIGGHVFGSRFAFKLSEIHGPEPDVAYVRPGRLHLVEEGAMQGPPDIAVEVVSRDSRSRDYVKKRQLYEQSGVEEYWLVDPLGGRVEMLRLSGGRYAPAPLEAGRIFRSQVIPGFWLNVEWLLSDPPAPPYACLRELLEG